MTQPEPPRSYILKGLEEVGLPDHVSWFPQTLGWKILAMILLLVVMYFSYKKARSWWLNRYRMEALKVTTALPLDDPKFEYKLFIIIKRVMGHLDAQHQALYGEQFVMALTSYPMRSPIQLAPPLAQAWLASLTSTQYALTESDKQALKHYCLAWLQYHHLGRGQ